MTPSVTNASQIPASLFSKTGNSIYNDEIRQFLANCVSDWFKNTNEFADMVAPALYVEEMERWIGSSKLNQVTGLEHFRHRSVSLGVTQALDQFHSDILLNGRKLRMLRGEYPYSRDVHPFSFANDFIDDRPLEKGDAVILSCPFSASGDIHPQMVEIFDTCQKLDIPLFLDMAWFGTCGGLNVDLSHPGITQVAFSLTKGLTCGNYRSGVRFAKNLLSDPVRDRLALQQEWTHGIHLNTRIGFELMKNFSPDTQFNKYRDAQLAICQAHKLSPSLCVHIASSQESIWNEFSRDGFCNRLNLREAIKKILRAPVL